MFPGCDRCHQTPSSDALTPFLLLSYPGHHVCIQLPAWRVARNLRAPLLTGVILKVQLDVTAPNLVAICWDFCCCTHVVFMVVDGHTHIPSFALLLACLAACTVHTVHAVDRGDVTYYCSTYGTSRGGPQYSLTCTKCALVLLTLAGGWGAKYHAVCQCRNFLYIYALLSSSIP